MKQLDSIGKWKVFALETGIFSLDGGAMMGTVPKVLWEKTNPSDSLNRIDLSLRCMLVDDGENVVLIESGIGDKNPEKFTEMFNIRELTSIEKALNDTCYSYKNITHIVLTHLHFDHAGGAMIFNKNGELIPAFPNAKYYISESNWKAGMNPSERDRASYIKDNYVGLLDAGVLNIIPENTEILPGLNTYVVNGHTYGQQLVKVSDKNKCIVFCSDLIPLKSHLKLPWIMGYDLNASLTLQEKKVFLDKASEGNWWLFFYHDPSTVAVRIKKSNKYYEVIDEYV